MGFFQTVEPKCWIDPSKPDVRFLHHVEKRHRWTWFVGNILALLIEFTFPIVLQLTLQTPAKAGAQGI